MHITAVSIGSFGDVKPFIVLGNILKKQGHTLSIATFSEHKEKIIENELGYFLIEGSLDQMMRTLLSDSDNSSSSGVNGIQSLLESAQYLFDNLDEACKNADLIIYMQFGALAYHFAQKYNIPCIRTFVFPFDSTKQYSALMSSTPDNTIRCKLTYWLSDLFMNYASLKTVNAFRKKLGLSQWHIYNSYKKMNKQKLITLYQYSPLLAPPDKNWGKHIFVTGVWEEEAYHYEPEQKLVDFLNIGETPIYIGFGSMKYSKMEYLADTIYNTLKITGQRAILSSELNPKGHYKSDEQILFIDFVPFHWLFSKVRAVIHHGGCGTTHLGLKYGRPTFVIAFGADQMFWGKRIAKVRCGPMPLDIKKDNLNERVITQKLKDLLSPIYKEKATALSEKLICEDGKVEAASIINQYFR